MSTDLTPRKHFTNDDLLGEGLMTPEEEVRIRRELLSGKLDWGANRRLINEGKSAGAITSVKCDGYGNLTPILPLGMPSDLRAQAESLVRNMERKTRVLARLRMRLLKKAAPA